MLVLAMLPVLAMAQSYFVDGMRWKTRTYPCCPLDKESVYVTTLEGEETIDGYTALKMYSENEDEPSSRVLKAYIRTDGDKVYFRKVDSEIKEWRLMYDFGLKEGEGCYVYALNREEDINPRSYIKCVGISHDAESQLDVMKLEEYDDETCGSFVRHGKWFKGLASELGVEYNNYFELDGGGTRLIEARYGGDIVYSWTPTNIADATAPALGARVAGTTLTVTGIAAPCRVQLFAADGTLVGSMVAVGGSARMVLPGKGMYVLKAGGKTMKIHN